MEQGPTIKLFLEQVLFWKSDIMSIIRLIPLLILYGVLYGITSYLGIQNLVVIHEAPLACEMIP